MLVWMNKAWNDRALRDCDRYGTAKTLRLHAYCHPEKSLGIGRYIFDRTGALRNKLNLKLVTSNESRVLLRARRDYQNYDYQYGE